MKKIIKNLLIITLLLLFTIPLYGCASTATGPYLYDNTNYSIGNMAFTEEISVILNTGDEYAAKLIGKDTKTENNALIQSSTKGNNLR